MKKFGGLGLGLETQSLGLGLGLDKKVLFTSLVKHKLKVVTVIVDDKAYYLRHRLASKGIVTLGVTLYVCPPSHARRITLGGEGNTIQCCLV